MKRQKAVSRNNQEDKKPFAGRIGRINGDLTHVDIEVPESSYIQSLTVRRGKAKIVVGENVAWRGHIIVGNGEIYIGDGTIARGVDIITANSKVCVGKECLLSWDVKIMATDSHPIYDLNSGERINMDEDIIIGDRVWVSRNVSIMKGVEIGNDSVIALGSIVTKSAPKNVLIAGIPAKVRRENIFWSNKTLSKKEIEEIISQKHTS